MVLVTIQQLAEGMVNPGSDPEKLVIQYTVSTPEKPVTTCVSKDTLESILIPRKRRQGDTLFTLIFRGKGNATSEYVTGLETWLWQPCSVSSEHMALYKRLHIPGVEDELITSFGKLVDITHDPNNKDYNTNRLIQSFFRALSQHAKHIRYEAWNSEQDLESYSLAKGLEKFSKSFPPKFPSDKDNDARVKVYHVTLTRLLVLVHAHKSDPSIDLRIWQLAGQLLAIAGTPDPKNEFAIKIGSFVVKGVLDFCMGEAKGDGGGNPGHPNAGGAAQGRSGNRWGWGRTLGCAAGLVTLGALAISPAIVIVPVANVLGFQATGVLAGSIAAGWQAILGNVGAGSLFAMLQGVGAAGAASAAGAPLLATVSTVAAGGAGYLGRTALSGVGANFGNGEFEFAITIILLGL